jgi:hypothetical protein
MSNAVSNRSFKFEDVVTKDNRNLKKLVGSEGNFSQSISSKNKTGNKILFLFLDYHFDKRAKLLHIGYIDTVNFLCKLPLTEHEPSSFKLDNCFFSVKFTIFH